MTQFETDAYLSDEMTKIESVVYAQHKDWFDLAYELNAYTRRHAPNYIAHSRDGQETLSVAALIKILNSFQALVILSRKGMPHEATILLRTIFETTVILKLLCVDAEYFRRYAQSDFIHRKQLLAGAKKNPHPMFDSTRSLIDKGELARIDEEIKRLGITEEKIKQRAIDAGMGEYYDSVYRLACETCHAGPRSLEDYVKTDGSGEIAAYTSGPFTEVDFELLTSINFVILALESLNGLFKVEHLDGFSKIAARFIELQKKG